MIRSSFLTRFIFPFGLCLYLFSVISLPFVFSSVIFLCPWPVQGACSARLPENSKLCFYLRVCLFFSLRSWRGELSPSSCPSDKRSHSKIYFSPLFGIDFVGFILLPSPIMFLESTPDLFFFVLYSFTWMRLRTIFFWRDSKSQFVGRVRAGFPVTPFSFCKRPAILFCGLSSLSSSLLFLCCLLFLTCSSWCLRLSPRGNFFLYPSQLFSLY